MCVGRRARAEERAAEPRAMKPHVKRNKRKYTIEMNKRTRK